jgi:hypothetical protein
MINLPPNLCLLEGFKVKDGWSAYNIWLNVCLNEKLEGWQMALYSRN